tara:strand:- start:1402 stop:1839 length:438 start_codon:yes stop_codon:yes gene_type:complete
MNEHSFVKSVHRKLDKSVYVWKIADRYSGGVPDAMYAGPAGILFIEYKYIKLPKRLTTFINTGLSPLQEQWITQMQQWKHPTWLVIGADKSCLILNKLTKNISTAYYHENKTDTKTLAQLITDVTQGQPNEQNITRAKSKKNLGK